MATSSAASKSISIHPMAHVWKAEQCDVSMNLLYLRLA